MKTKLARQLLLAPLLAFTHVAVADAATYYIAPNGSDSNPGTLASPFATLQKAHDLAMPGDTIYMRGGTYRFPRQTYMNRSGSSGQRINVFNYADEVPVLDGSANNTVATEKVLALVNAAWWHFKGLEITNSPQTGFILDSVNNVIIERCKFHHNGRLAKNGDGLGLGGASSNNLILNNDSYLNRYLPDPGSSNGIAPTGVTGTGNILRGNRAWRNGDDGFDLWDSLPGSLLLENNWSWENGYDENLTPLPLGNGVGFKLGGAGSGDGGHTIRNNLAWRNRTNGFDANSADLPMDVYNNTAFENGGSNYHFYNGTVAYVLKNNLSLPPKASIGPSTLATFNSWNLGVTVDAADFVTLDFSANMGPRKADGSLPDSNFLRLASGSDVIDKGVDVGLPYSGAAPDLGAYESGATTTTCQATPLNAASLISDGGFAWMNPDQTSFGTAADTSTASAVSTLRLFEGATELGPAHAAHADVRNLGLGRFSHWSSDGNATQSIRFSTTDNSNPTTNGRTYSYTAGCTPSGTKLAAPTNLRIVSP